MEEEIFEHILNKALHDRAVDPSMIFIDGTHIKGQREQEEIPKRKVAQVEKVYANQLREGVNAEREKLGKQPIEEDEEDDDKGSGGGSTKEISVSTTDPESGMFVKGEHERQFAYEVHTAILQMAWSA